MSRELRAHEIPYRDILFHGCFEFAKKRVLMYQLRGQKMVILTVLF